MTKFFYRKSIGLLIVIIGLSYCLTSFYNFYDYIFGEVTVANANIYLMASGLVFPLYTFIFGMYFYFYIDKEVENINLFILSTGVVMFFVGLARIFVSSGIMQFIHHSFAYAIILLGIMVVYGCFKYKY